MKELVYFAAPILTAIGSVVSLGMAFYTYRLRAKAVDLAKTRMSPTEGPIVEDEFVDPGFEDNDDDNDDVKDRDDE